MATKRKSGTSHDENEPGDISPVKPQIIEGTAEVLPDEATDMDPTVDEPNREEEVSTAKQQFSTPEPQTPSRRRSLALPLAALIVGALGGGWLYRDVLSSYLPTQQITALQTRSTELESTISKLSTDLETLKSGSSKSQTDIQSAVTASQDAQSSASTLAAKQETTETRLAKVESSLATAAKDMASLRNDLASRPTVSGASPPNNTALQALDARLAKLESEFEKLQTRTTAGVERQSATIALLQRISRGEPYAAELSVLATQLPAEILPMLQEHADKGIANESMLLAELSAMSVVAQAQQPVTQEPSWYENLLSGIITVTPIGETDWKSVMEQALAASRPGGLVAAVSSLDTAEQAAPLPPDLSAWRNKARQRLALDDMLQSRNLERFGADQ
jgi:uncharacterized phage infection (PIP) family protein YhgE